MGFPTQVYVSGARGKGSDPFLRRKPFSQVPEKFWLYLTARSPSIVQLRLAHVWIFGLFVRANSSQFRNNIRSRGSGTGKNG